jgi:hypothetical protein
MFGKNKNKQIIFKEATKQAQYLKNIPKPSSNTVPNWFKEQTLFTDGSRNINNFLKADHPVGATYKLCVPLTDSVTSGYTATLPVDIYVKNISKENSYIPRISWNVDWEVLDNQNNEFLGNYPIPHGYTNILFRWSLDWKIETPSGYSSLIVHPFHQNDLPFFTVSALVDTDMFPNRLFLPFFIKDGFEGIIKEGTPIAQIFPIKREVWESSKGNYSDEDAFNINNLMKFNFIKAYKNKYWSKKDYR